MADGNWTENPAWWALILAVLTAAVGVLWRAFSVRAAVDRLGSNVTSVEQKVVGIETKLDRHMAEEEGELGTLRKRLDQHFRDDAENSRVLRAVARDVNTLSGKFDQHMTEISQRKGRE